MATSPDLPADLARDRYGRRGPWPRWQLALIAGCVAAIALGWVAWVTLWAGSRELTWQDVGYRVISDGAAEVTFDVRFTNRVAPSATAVCTLQAQNQLHTEVGLRDVTVGPARRRTLRVTGRLPTSERATTVLVKDCALR